MTHLMYTGEEDVYKPGVYREIYDPACGTGGMLSVLEETIRAGNDSANLGLYGQEYNDESWGICCSDMLIKDEETDQIVLGDTLGDGKTRDGFPDKQFHYMLANPPFGVEWKDQQKEVEKEAKELGFSGRFGAGLPAINDGSLLFLQHMLSKVKNAPERGGEGSKIAIIFNGSPLFSGDAGSGPSNIRRWVIENDWLDAIVALPDLSIVRQRRGAANRLGFAVQLCYLRYPGTVLGVNQLPLPALLHLVAGQLQISVERWAEYGERAQTRREHLVELQTALWL